MKAIYLQWVTATIGSLGCLLPSQSLAQTYPDQPQRIPGRRAYSTTLRDESSGGMNRFFEVRAGARICTINGKLRPGLDGSSDLDLGDDLGLDGIEAGPQFDFEMKVSPEWHARFSFAGSYFDGPTKTTTRAITYQSPTATPNNPTRTPVTLAVGSRLQTKFEINSFSGMTWYEGYKTENFVLGPSVGFKAIFYDETITIFNAGTRLTSVDNTEVDEVTPLVGAEMRLQVNPNVYVGMSPYGFALDKYYYLGGNGYIGFDFDKEWGLRFGLDVDHLVVEFTEASKYSASSTLLAAFVQGVYGF